MSRRGVKNQGLQVGEHQNGSRLKTSTLIYSPVGACREFWFRNVVL